MAIYRAVYKKIWKDPHFQLYPPEGKLLFIYLFTNESTTESGIYTITQKTISDELGISLPTVSELFANCLKNVSYDLDNHCVFVKKFRRYNAGGNPKLIRASVIKDMRLIPQTILWLEFIKEYPEYQKEYEEVSNLLANRLPTVIQQIAPSASSTSSSKSNSISNSSSAKEPLPPLVLTNEAKVFRCYQENIGMITSMILTDELKDISKTYPDGWFEDAMKEAIKSMQGGKPNLKYVTKIMERWVNSGKNNGHKPEMMPKGKFGDGWE